MSNDSGQLLELLALIMEREGYLTREQTLAVVAHQAAEVAAGRTSAFGDVAVQLKFCTPTDVRYSQSIEVQLQVPPGRRRPLGYYLLEQGMLLPSQLLEALEEQAFFGTRVGEILVRNGHVTDADIEHCLTMQQQAEPLPTN